MKSSRFFFIPASSGCLNCLEWLGDCAVNGRKVFVFRHCCRAGEKQTGMQKKRTGKHQVSPEEQVRIIILDFIIQRQKTHVNSGA